jgi:hypothetical protein
MIAASAEDQSIEVVRALLDSGAALNVRDKLGRTALDWSLMQGESQVSRLLEKRGAAKAEWNPAQPDGVAEPRPLREALRLATDQLQRTGPQFHKGVRCISCHHQSLLAIAVHVAANRGVPVDESMRKHPAEATLAMWAPSRENFLMGNCSIFGFLGNVSYGLLALAEEGFKSNAITDAAASCLSSLQWPDGRWEGGDMRPPLAGRTPFVYTALAIRALKTYAVPARRDETTAQIARARTFLQANSPKDTQGESFRLLGLARSSTSNRQAGPAVS